MSYDYSKNKSVKDSSANLLRDELGGCLCLELGEAGVNGTFGRKIYREIVPWRYFRQAVMKLNPWLTEAQNRLLPKLISGEIEV